MLNPEYGVGDIAKELGKKWSDADPETKSKYEAMAEKDKARYERVKYLNLMKSLTFLRFSIHHNYISFVKKRKVKNFSALYINKLVSLCFQFVFHRIDSWNEPKICVIMILKYDKISFLSQEMTAYKKKIQNDGAPMMGGAPANQTVKSDSEEEWKEDDE